MVNRLSKLFQFGLLYFPLPHYVAFINMTNEFIEILESIIVSYIAEDGEKLQDVYRALSYTFGKIENLARDKDIKDEILKKLFELEYERGKADAWAYLNRDKVLN